MAPEHLEISWCNDVDCAQELADFFSKNVGPEYISHSELQGQRAISPNQWRENISEILREEIEVRLSKSLVRVPGLDNQPILVAQLDGALVGLSFVTFAGSAAVPFGIIEDLIVSSAKRGRGVGKVMLDWIVAEARSRKIKRLFLESKADNWKTHRFFEREGFQACSIVMLRVLGEH
jgi:GNAT superfamily N-acetyltransferase